MNALTKIHMCSVILGNLIATALFFFVNRDGRDEALRDLVHDVVDVRAALDGGYQIGERDMLVKGLKACCEC